MFQHWQFQYPQALWLLCLIPLFILFFISYSLWKKRAAKRIGDLRLVKQQYTSYSSLKSVLKFILIVAAFALGCIALANPREPDEMSSETRSGIDIIVALDVSNSMLATDELPNRLQLAKQMVLKLMDRLPDDRIGLVLFAGSSYLQMPLTFDHNAAQMYVSGASTTAIPAQGTAVGDALQKCNIAFDKNTERFKSVILISDGETHDEDALEVSKELASEGIMINTVGIGSPGGSTIIDTTTNNPKRDEFGNVVVSKLNEQFLQQLAASTNGIYIHLTNTDKAVNTLIQQLSQIEKKALPDTSLLVYKNYYFWLALPVLLLLITEIFMGDRKRVYV
ncbi:MAG: VWA domain-containing protein [Chitinophagaceae bacterium]|nr:VWA domain-containing protein [Chitinophagaceae bacterium]